MELKLLYKILILPQTTKSRISRRFEIMQSFKMKMEQNYYPIYWFYCTCFRYIFMIGMVLASAHTDPGVLKYMQNPITLEFMQGCDSILLRMTKNWYITDCYVQLFLVIQSHMESYLCINSRVMEFRMFFSSPGSVCTAAHWSRWAQKHAKPHYPRVHARIWFHITPYDEKLMYNLSLIHIWRCRRIERCRSRWSPYH